MTGARNLVFPFRPFTLPVEPAIATTFATLRKLGTIPNSCPPALWPRRVTCSACVFSNKASIAQGISSVPQSLILALLCFKGPCNESPIPRKSKLNTS
ncbi:hypothetical protein D9M71_499770 [compost metagenome]